MFLCHNDGADDKARFPVISHVFAFDLKQTCKGVGGEPQNTFKENIAQTSIPL